MTKMDDALGVAEKVSRLNPAQIGVLLTMAFVVLSGVLLFALNNLQNRMIAVIEQNTIQLARTTVALERLERKSTP